MSMEMQESIKPVVTRLRWGLPAVEAFADGMWRELAHLVQQVQQLGIKSDSALGNLRLDLNHTHRSRRISRLESLAAKSVIPVSLLQLPAFILIGIVPAVANQFSSLLTTFLPFNS
jgi:pilus assembly protein TadC